MLYHSPYPVPKNDMTSFVTAQHDFLESGNEGYEEMRIVDTYPDEEYYLARNLVAEFGCAMYCASGIPDPGVTDRVAIFLKNLDPSDAAFRPLWIASHELCHVFERASERYAPFLERVKQLVDPTAWEARRKFEDGDPKYALKPRDYITAFQPIDRTPHRKEHIWKEVMADCNASMWTDHHFRDGLRLAVRQKGAHASFIAMLDALSAFSNKRDFKSYELRVWYPPAARNEITLLFTDLVMAYLPMQ